MNIDFTQIFLGLIYLIIAIITGVFVPCVKNWIETKITIEQQNTIRTIVTTTIYAAQQIFDSDEGEQKKSYALQQISAALEQYGINLSSDEINTYIEGILKDIKTSLNEDTKW